MNIYLIHIQFKLEVLPRDLFKYILYGTVGYTLSHIPSSYRIGNSELKLLTITPPFPD